MTDSRGRLVFIRFRMAKTGFQYPVLVKIPASTQNGPKIGGDQKIFSLGVPVNLHETRMNIEEKKFDVEEGVGPLVSYPP